MKKILTILAAFFYAGCVHATTLMQVYEQALASDPIYQQAVAQRLATNEIVPLNIAPLLPQASIDGGPLLNKTHVNGVADSSALSTTSRGYSMTLSLSQTVFNYAQIRALTGAKATSRQADATLNAASQNLMLRVAQAYFAVLRDAENLRYNVANKNVFHTQVDEITQQYKLGLKTVTDVYTSEASYDTAFAGLIAAQTALANDKENLRAITGVLYPSLATLSDTFPLITPEPANMDAWVETAQRQNWAIHAALFANEAARENIKQQNAGHYPTVTLQGAYNVSYSNTLGGAPISSVTPTDTVPEDNINGTLLPGVSHTQDASVTLNLGIPIFQGGQVVAQTNQAKYNYQVTQQQLEQVLRATINQTRQSYLGIILGIKQIQADRQAVKSLQSSYNGLHEGYKVGTQTLVSVLNQQQRIFQAQSQYATDRYAYVYNLLLLKQAAGTLSSADLQAIDAWLNNEVSVADTNTNVSDPEIRAEISAKNSSSHTLRRTHALAMSRAVLLNSELAKTKD
jgi:outer membrane protein